MFLQPFVAVGNELNSLHGSGVGVGLLFKAGLSWNRVLSCRQECLRCIMQMAECASFFFALKLLSCTAG